MENIVLIGTGKRVINTVIPAILISNKFKYIDIVSREKGKSIEIEDWNFSYKCIDLKEIKRKQYKYLYLGIPNQFLYSVLKKSLEYIDHRNTVLIIDTPIPITKNILKLSKLIKQFKKVTILEDCLFLKPYSLAFNAEKAFGLGKPKKFNFFHSGFKYHAYAQVKKFFNVNYFTLVCKFGSKNPIFSQIIFRNLKILSFIYEPRDYSVGKFIAIHENGFLSDYKLQTYSQNLEIFVKPNILKGQFTGFNIFRGDKLLNLNINNVKFKLNQNEYSSIFPYLKILAVSQFMDILITDQENPYTPAKAAYDSIVNGFISRFGFFIDLPIPFSRHSIISLFLEKLF